MSTYDLLNSCLLVTDSGLVASVEEQKRAKLKYILFFFKLPRKKSVTQFRHPPTKDHWTFLGATWAWSLSLMKQYKFLLNVFCSRKSMSKVTGEIIYLLIIISQIISHLLTCIFVFVSMISLVKLQKSDTDTFFGIIKLIRQILYSSKV